MALWLNGDQPSQTNSLLYSINSLQEYLLVSQDEMLVEGYARQDNDTWLYTKVTGLEGKLTLRSIECELALKDVYDKAS